MPNVRRQTLIRSDLRRNRTSRRFRCSNVSEETLRDDSAILIRTIQPDDKDRLREHPRGLATEAVYHRFMGYKRELANDELQRFTELDFTQHIGLAAVLSEDSNEHIVGVGRYIRTSNKRAEVAFSVVDKHQGRGVGTLLLARLGRIGTSLSQSGILLRPT
jgi:GNAT superfamily N-acetyltransferase